MPTHNFHGPENAEHELRKAYNLVIESEVVFTWDRRPIPGVDPAEVTRIYRRAFQAHRKGDRLAAERWARTAKHLSRAFWAEAKLAFLEPHSTGLPFLTHATPEEFNLREQSATTADLLDSLSEDVPPGLDKIPAEMTHFLSRARKHLEKLKESGYTHELLRAERIKAAHEYGRVLECMALAFEAEATHGKGAA